MTSRVSVAQVRKLSEHPLTHTFQGSITATQIREAVKKSLRPGANDVPEILLIAESMADILDLASQSFRSSEINLEGQIATLEQQVAQLTNALQHAEARAEASEALIDGLMAELEEAKLEGREIEGFWLEFKKTAGEKTAALPCFFGKTGVVYYLIVTLGPTHPLVKLLEKLLGG